MSATLQTIVLVAAGFLTVLAALQILRKWIFPAAKGIVTFNESFVPNVKYMKDLPKLNKILSVVEELAKQVRRDSGSSMRDEIDQLAAHARENREAAAEAKQAALDAKEAAEGFARTNAAGIVAAAENAQKIEQGLTALEVLVGTMKEHAKDERELARGDRDIARDALGQLRDLLASARRTEESGARTEASGERIEADRASVATDLAATQRRADEVPRHEPPGAAADAASQSPEE